MNDNQKDREAEILARQQAAFEAANELRKRGEHPDQAAWCNGKGRDFFGGWHDRPLK